MLYGNREDLLEALRNDPDVFESISEEFQSDPEILKAVGIINSELKSDDVGFEGFTTNVGDMIDFTSSEYEKIIQLINDMKKIQFDIINSVSLIDDVNLSDADFSKVSDRIDSKIKKLEDMKLNTDDLISRIISSIVIDSRLILKKFKSSERSRESETDDILNLLEDNQYILGKKSNGDYYLSLSTKLGDNEIINIKSQIVSMKPELSDIDFKIDNGEVISSENYQILLNGYVDDRISNSNSDELVSSDGEFSHLNEQKRFAEEDKVDIPKDESIKIEASEENINSDGASMSSDNEVYDNNSSVTADNESSNASSLVDTMSSTDNDGVSIPRVFDFSPVEVNASNGDSAVEDYPDGKVLGEDNLNIQESGCFSNGGFSEPNIFNAKPGTSKDEVDCQFVFGKKDGVYYLVINPEISSEDVIDIKMRIAESMPGLAGSSFVIDYGNILSDSSFETVLTGFVKKESESNFDNFMKR